MSPALVAYHRKDHIQVYIWGQGQELLETDASVWEAYDRPQEATV